MYQNYEEINMGKIYLTEKTIKELIVIKGDIPRDTKMRKNYVPHLEAIKFLIEHYKKCKNFTEKAK